MYRYGPLVNYWCMRYEAKHSFFKKLSSIIGNYINLPLTMAKRHQHLQCYRMVCPEKFLHKDLTFGKGTSSMYVHIYVQVWHLHIVILYPMMTCTHISYIVYIVESVVVGEVPEGELLEGAGLGLTSKSALSS